MSKEITDWIKDELYPTLFQSIDIALPEHNFKSYAGGWRSKTYLDGSPHKHRIDKTVITKIALSRILEQGGDNLSLVDYVIQRENIEFIEAVKKLADIVGLQLPKGDFNEGAYIKQNEKNSILENANRFFIESLKNPLSASCIEYNSQTHDVSNYLSWRGYTDSDIESMELGCINADGELYQYLLNKGHSYEDIKGTIDITSDNRICRTHLLTIPYRSGGYIKGFKFRTIGGDNPKYINSVGLDKNGAFFNLLGIKGDKDLVIVEGELDSLSATVKGVENVVACGGSSIYPEQIKDAIRKGAKSFTICFNKEPEKEEETKLNIEKAIEVILREGVNRVYIVTLPDLGGAKTDPDRLIKESGVEAFNKSLRGALPYYEY
jgi:DNA primase